MNNHLYAPSPAGLPSELPASRAHDLGPGRQGYAVGFALDGAGRVALIRKRRPTWQAGRLNGIGGKVEPGESPLQAMRREFLEEAGAHVECWDHIACLTFEAGVVWVFRAHVGPTVLDSLRSCTDELVEVVDIVTLLCGKLPVLPNLTWLVPLAAYTHDTYTPLMAHEIEGASGPTT